MTFLTPELKPILGPTYGAIVYQEQVMQIFRELAGYTLGGADQVRRYMSKKKMDKLVKEREAFIHGDEKRSIPGCVANGISEEAASKLFDQMTDFAKYAFNKSHAAAYAANSYYTAWLKYHYPAEFLAAAMNWADDDKLPGLMADARRMNVKILVPDVNYSGEHFVVTPDGKIRYGLTSIKAVGSAAKEIIKERKENGKYVSLADFFMRTETNRKAVENLMKAGAFDVFSSNRKAMLETLDDFKEAKSRVKKAQSRLEAYQDMAPVLGGSLSKDELLAEQEKRGIKLKTALTNDRLKANIESAEAELEKAREEMNDILPDEKLKEDEAEKNREEYELLGAYVTSHPMDRFGRPEIYGATPISDLSADTEVLAAAMTEPAVKKTKSAGKPMATMKLDDRTGQIEAVMFPQIYSKYQHLVKEGLVALFHGYVKEADTEGEDKTSTFIIQSAEAVPEHRARYLWSVSGKVAAELKRRPDDFRKKYGQKTGTFGNELYIEDPSGTVTQLPFLVSDDISKLSGVRTF